MFWNMMKFAARALLLSVVSVSLSGLSLRVVAGEGQPIRTAGQTEAPTMEANSKARQAADKPRSQAAELRKPARVHTDLYGDSLPSTALVRLGTVRFRPGGFVHSLAFSPDGKRLVSGGSDSGLRLWEVSTGKEILHFKASADSSFVAPRSVAFSTDGKFVASGGCNGDSWIRLWDAATGEEVRRLAGLPASILVGAVAFLPDGKALVSAGSDGTVRIWDIASGTELRHFDGQVGSIDGLALSSDGNIVAVCGEGLNLWEVATGNRLHQLKGHTGMVASTAFARDGKTLLSSGADRTVRCWDVATGRELERRFGNRLAFSMRFSPDGKTLALEAEGSMILLFEATTGKTIHTITWPAESIAFSPDSRTLASCGQSAVQLWDVATGNAIGPTGGHREQVEVIAFPAHGETMASASNDGEIRVWDTSNGKLIRQFGGWWDQISSCTFSADARTLAIAGTRSLTTWDLATGREVRLRPQRGDGQVLAASADGKTLAYASLDGKVCLCDTSTGREFRQFEGTSSPKRLLFSPDSSILVLASPHTKAIDLFAIATGRRVQQLVWQYDTLYALVFSPDGKTLAASGFSKGGRSLDYPIYLWDAATGKELCRFKGNQSFSYALALSPDGKTLASVIDDRVIRLWEVATGKERCQFHGHEGIVLCLSFSPDGKRVASGGTDKTVLIWDVTGLREDGRSRSTDLAAKDLESLWVDLASEDAPKAHRAIWVLSAVPLRALPFLQGRLHPVSPVDPQRIERLVADLDSNRFAVREKASQELEKLGEQAEPALRRTLATNPSAEVGRRAGRLLNKLIVHHPDRMRGLRAIEVLEHMGSGEARNLLERLARGAPGVRLTEEARAARDRSAKP